MKKHSFTSILKFNFALILFYYLGFQGVLIAQVSINNDGTAPDASAQLELKSTTKGLLLPRIALPADVNTPKAGLVIYNQATNTPYFHNGNNWADFTFTVPYTATKLSSIDLIKLNQTGLGRGIYAKTGSSGVLVGVHSGYAVVGEGSTLGGVFGASNTGIGNTGISNTSFGVYGKSTSSYGLYGFVGSSNVSFIIDKAGVFGEGFDSPGVLGNSGSSAGVYGQSISSHGVAGFSSSSNGIYGNSVSGNGVRGNTGNPNYLTNNNTAGVLGESSTGSGVEGYSDSFYGVAGKTNLGIAVSGQSQQYVGGDFLNVDGTNSGLVGSKLAIYSGAYSNNPIVDLEVRHITNNTGNGMSGFRIYNSNATGGPKGWTFYTAAGGNLELYYNGTLHGNFNFSSGAYTGSSDERKKENIYNMSSVLSKVNALSPKYYNYKTAKTKTMGFLAQDIDKIFPELVSSDGGKGDEYTLNYNGFGVIAIKAIQEQQAIIEQLTKRILALENK